MVVVSPEECAVSDDYGSKNRASRRIRQVAVCGALHVDSRQMIELLAIPRARREEIVGKSFRGGYWRPGQGL
jgi:hypothetical protein